MEGSTGKTRNPWRVAKAKLGRGPSKRDDDPKISPKNPLEERGVGLHILPEVIKDIDAQKGNKGSPRRGLDKRRCTNRVNMVEARSGRTGHGAAGPGARAGGLWGLWGSSGSAPGSA